MHRLFSENIYGYFDVSYDSLSSIIKEANVGPVEGTVFKNSISLRFNNQKNRQSFFEFLKQKYFNQFNWKKVEAYDLDHNFFLKISDQNNIMQFQNIFYLKPEQTFIISQESLAIIGKETNAIPTHGFVYERNILLWFETEEDAELFYNFLRQHYLHAFDWTRIQMNKTAENTYVVDIKSKDNMTPFRQLFNLQPTGPDEEYHVSYGATRVP